MHTCFDSIHIKLFVWVMVPFEKDVEVASFKATGNFIEHLLPHIFIVVPSLGISVVNA